MNFIDLPYRGIATTSGLTINWINVTHTNTMTDG